MTRQIKLTKGKIALVDDGDFETLSQYRWSASQARGTCYAQRGTRKSDLGYTKRTHIYMHREILGLKPGDGIIVDHRNSDGLDNRRVNLRTANQHQNHQNRIKHVRASSHYKGVTGRPGRWIAKIVPNRHTVILGMFKTEDEAASVYDSAALFLFGSFAKTNGLSSFPRSPDELRAQFIGKHDKAALRGKLTRAQVAEIRQLRKQGLLLREIAKSFHVSEATVSMIANRIEWK